MKLRLLTVSVAALSTLFITGCATIMNDCDGACPIGSGTYKGTDGTIKKIYRQNPLNPADAIDCSVQFSVLDNRDNDAQATVQPYQVFGRVDDSWPSSTVPVKANQVIGLDSYWPIGYRDVKAKRGARIYLVIKSGGQTVEYPPKIGFKAGEFICTGEGITLPALKIRKNRLGRLTVTETRFGRYR